MSAGVFSGCTQLSTANFPSVASVGSSAFYYCYGLTDVSFAAAHTINPFAFGYC